MFSTIRPDRESARPPGARRLSAGLTALLLVVVGAGPLALASAGQASAAAGADHTVMYVTDSGDATVTAYDTTTGDVVAQIPVGDLPWDVLADPGNGSAYVSNAESGTISVIDTATDAVTGTITVGSSPEELALSPDESTLYVADEAGNAISVINTATNTVTATYTGLPGPSGLAVSPDGSTVYASLYNASEVVAVSTATGEPQVLVTFNTGDKAGLQNTAISPNGDEVYTAVEYEDLAAAVEVPGNTVTETPVESGPYGVAISPDGSTLYIGNAYSDTITTIDTATNAVTDSIPVGSQPMDIALNPDGSALYTANYKSGTVSVLDTATDEVISTLTGFDQPIGIGFAQVPPPAVTGVSPDQGPEAGGRTVTVTGTGFEGATAVDFGGIPATSFTVTSPTTITATVPSDTTPGPVDVTVTTRIATSPTSAADQYTYLAAPTVTGVSPASGLPAGGTTVTITGTGFDGATAVDFGATPATSFTVTSPTTITATAPAEAAGTVNVTVTAPGGTSAITGVDQYTYAAADVAVTMSAVGSPGLPSGDITYTVTVTNNGPSALTSATITAPLPTPMAAESSECSTANQAVTCSIGALASGASTTRTFTVPVGLLTIGIPYAVTATRTASAPTDPNPANNSATRTCTILTSLIISCD